VGPRRQHPGRPSTVDLITATEKSPRDGRWPAGPIEPCGLPGLTPNALRNLHNPGPWAAISRRRRLSAAVWPRI